MIFGSQNACGDCGYTWYPRGRKRSQVCPNCHSDHVYIYRSKRGSGCFSLIVILALGYWAYSNLGELEKILPETKRQPGPTPKKEIKVAPSKAPAASLPPAKMAAKPKPKVPEVIKISATSENAIALAKQRYKLASEIFKEDRFERSENAAVSLTTALQLVTESSKILSKL
ncbi:MAG: hypothetical protein P1V97_37665, partial [Planctomycetota bacterium]|nr:hypothetical protein [Planctomycetota bacterium]